MNKLEKEVRFLKIYAGVATLLVLVFLLTAFTVGKNAKFDEIEVKRINLVDNDGKLRMVISNKDRQHPGMVDGKETPRKRDVAGMLFFNDKGDECGGLIFSKLDSGEQYVSLTFDKSRADQTVALQHLENKEGYWAGLVFNDENIDLPTRLAKIKEIEALPTKDEQRAAFQKMRENGEFLVQRLAIGKGRNKSALLALSDAKGKPRIEMSVEANGKPKLNFLDENGKVIYSLPEDAKK